MVDTDVLHANLRRLTWKAIIVVIFRHRRRVHITSVAGHRKRVCSYDESLSYRCRLSRTTPLSHQCVAYIACSYLSACAGSYFCQTLCRHHRTASRMMPVDTALLGILSSSRLITA